MQAEPRVRPNHSIERTFKSSLRELSAAAHVERCASAPANASRARCCLFPCSGTVLSEPALVRRAASSFFAKSRLGLCERRFGLRAPVLAWHGSRPFCAGSADAARGAAAVWAGRSSGVAPECAAPRMNTSARSLSARLLSSPAAWESTGGGASREPGLSKPGSHNTSIERTNTGGQQCAASSAVSAPVFAAHVERYASRLGSEAWCSA